MEITKCILQEKYFSKRLWGEVGEIALNTICIFG